MRKLNWLALLGAVFIGACVYDVPVTVEHEIPVEPAILGAWEHTPGGNESATTMRVFEFSDTEYLVHYLEDGLELFFRAYAINVGGISAVQLEAIGDGNEAVGKNVENRYTVAAYRMLDGKLEVRTLNSDLVSAEIDDGESLKAAMLKHKDHPELFNDPGLFQRVEG